MSIYGIIYCYTNLITKKQYIGQTINPDQRKHNHLHEATMRNSDYYFHRSIRKYGWDNFVYEVLEENVSRKELNNRETYYIKEYNTLWPNGYNQCLANSLDEVAIKKMRKTKRKKYESMTENERKQLTSHMCEKNKGSKRSAETKRKMSESMKKYLAENIDSRYVNAIRSDNTSGHKGVSFNRAGKNWQAYIHSNKKMTHLGYFDTKEQAIEARLKAEKERGR